MPTSAPWCQVKTGNFYWIKLRILPKILSDGGIKIIFYLAHKIFIQIWYIYVLYCCFQLIDYGNTVRSTGSTGVNADSSRSHAILQLEVKTDGGTKPVGRYYLPNPFPSVCGGSRLFPFEILGWCHFVYDVFLLIRESWNKTIHIFI